MSLAWQNRIRMLVLTIALAVIVAPAFAQSPSCTTLALGQTQDITAFSVCKRVTLASVPGPDAVSICVPTNIDAAQWASFYNNPPPGVTIAACSSGCAGYSYAGYCYYHAGDLSPNSCNAVCAGYGGCNAAGTRYAGSDDSSGARCSAVATGITATSIGAVPTASSAAGCQMNIYKGGWLAFVHYTITTTCADASATGRICACNN